MSEQKTTTVEKDAGTATERVSLKDKIVGKIAGKIIDAFVGIKAMSTDAVVDLDLDITAKDCKERGTTTTTVTTPTEVNTVTVTKVEKDSEFSGNILVNIKYTIKGDYTIGR